MTPSGQRAPRSLQRSTRAAAPGRATRLARLLAGHDWLAEVRCVALGPPHDDELGLALVPTPAGLRQLRTRGWRGVADELAQRAGPLAGVRLRFCETLAPSLDARELAALVCEPLPTAPVVTGLHTGDAGGLTLHLQVPLDLAICRVHFPRAPIVPGVVQIGWADALARDHRAPLGRFVALERVKFRDVVQPGDALVLTLAWDADRLAFRYQSAHGLHSSGRLVYEAAA